MNKKFALLMFAIGVGATTAPAFAELWCAPAQCAALRRECRMHPEEYTWEECQVLFENCIAACN